MICYIYDQMFLLKLFLLTLQTIIGVRPETVVTDAAEEVKQTNSMVIAATVPGVRVQNLQNPIILHYKHDIQVLESTKPNHSKLETRHTGT